MKQLMIAAGLCAVMGVSCKKDNYNANGSNNNGSNSNIAANTWVLTSRGSNTAVSSTVNDEAITFNSNSGTFLSLFFKTYPTQMACIK